MEKNTNSNDILIFERLNKEFLTFISLILFFVYPEIRDLIKLLFSNTDIDSTLLTGFAILIIYIPVAILIFKFPNVLKKDAVYLLGIILLYFIITLIIHPYYSKWYFHPIWGLKTRVFTFSTGIFGYFFVRLNREFRIFYNSLKVSSIIIFAANVIKPIEVIVNGHWSIQKGLEAVVSSPYSMGFGYRMLFPCLLFLYFFFKEKKKKYIILSIISLIEIFIWGSRGPILSIFVFIILYICFGDNRILKKTLHFFREHWKYLFLGLFVCVILFIKRNEIALSLLSILENIGIESRNLEMILSGSYTGANGRTRITNEAINLIKNSPLLGYGAYGDRYYINRYSHNFILEALITFGKIPGLIIILIVLFVSLKMLFIKNLKWKQLFILFFSFWVTRLWVSSSFWYETNFWVSIGIIVTYRKLEKR